MRQDLLESLDRHYAQVLKLDPGAEEMLVNLERADAARECYLTESFVTVPNILPANTWVSLADDIWSILWIISEEIRMIQEPQSLLILSDGARFRRVDPKCLQPVTREKTTVLLSKLGILEFGSMLAMKITPLIRHIVGPVEYERIYFYLYTEGDYITPHTDHHVGMRIDVQFPISLGTVGGLRVLRKGFLEMHYDEPGAMNILGSNVWHDVPPLLQTHPTIEPRRLNMGLRFNPV
jgi:hypothetical protein